MDLGTDRGRMRLTSLVLTESIGYEYVVRVRVPYLEHIQLYRSSVDIEQNSRSVCTARGFLEPGHTKTSVETTLSIAEIKIGSREKKCHQGVTKNAWLTARCPCVPYGLMQSSAILYHTAADLRVPDLERQ